MSGVQAVLFRVVAAALAVSLISAVPLKNAAERVVRTACGALLLLVLLGPLLRLRDVDPARYLERFQIDGSVIDGALQEGRQRAGALITEQTAAYIWDKAEALGAEARAEVTLAALSEHYQYPYAAVLTGRWTPEQKRELSDYLSQTLGIPPERQTWREAAS